MTPNPFFMVFRARFEMPPGTHHIGRSEDRPRPLTWDLAPVGVFRAATASAACEAAIRKSETLGTFFAVEGTPYGVATIAADDVDELDGNFGARALPPASERATDPA